MLRHDGGVTLVELMVSMALAGTLLATAWGTLATSQSAMWTSEAALQSHQVLRNALNAMEQDLVGAKIRSYYDGQLIEGNGTVYVKFQRINDDSTKDENPADGVADIVDANGNPRWDSQMYMYLWCPAGTATPSAFGANACTQIDQPPEGDQLLLVRADGSNPTGTNAGAWIRERVLINGSPTEGELRGFAVAVRQATGEDVPHAARALSPWADCQTTSAEECISPFRVADLDRLPIHLDVTIETETSVLGSIGRSVRRQVSGRVMLRNPQR